MPDSLFPQRPQLNPVIYAYAEPKNLEYQGLLKVGYTTRSAKDRVAEQYPTARPGKKPYKIVIEESAMREDGTTFDDHAVHQYLKQAGKQNAGGEWFKCTEQDVRAAIAAVRNRQRYQLPRDWDFTMRAEQQEAVERTAQYFKQQHKKYPDQTPRFLWNAKMRFGKTFAAYQLAKKMGWRKLLVITFKPAVSTAWEEDLMRHVDFEGWQYICKDGLSYDEIDKNKPFVCFASFQDFLGKSQSGGIKLKNEWAHALNWDGVILDEYHWGAWRDTAQELFEAEDRNEQQFGEGEGIDNYDQDMMPITTNAYLYLSGTPFRAIATGEFLERQIFNWTYNDEQQAKQNWGKNNNNNNTVEKNMVGRASRPPFKNSDKADGGLWRPPTRKAINQNIPNPYAALPRMVLMTYQLPDHVKDIALKGEFDEFDLNEFFAADGKGPLAKFKYEQQVQKWLDIIRGALSASNEDNLKLRGDKPPMPFSDTRLLSTLCHTFWFLPNVASCEAMANLLEQRNNRFYHDYEVIVAAGPQAGIGAAALGPVRQAMGDPLKTKSITLSCGKLTTGVTVRPWTGIFMLRNLSAPETYFQAAFRVQSPWTVDNPTGDDPNKQEIIKPECYVFDFAPERALKQIFDYTGLDTQESNPEKKIAEFISFLPVLAYDGYTMKQIDAAGVLQYAISGTTATMLAKRWESTLLVHVDNDTLGRLMANEKAMDALMKIEGFRNLNQDLATIINRTDAIKKTRQEKGDDITPKEKKQLTEEEKKYKSMRKQIQEKLLKFAARVPVFMYLTDYREQCLKDVITQLEPALFKKVTGLEVSDFDELVSMDVFDSQRMNQSVLGFRQYEDSSLVYTGINRHEGQGVGGFDTTISNKEYIEMRR